MNHLDGQAQQLDPIPVGPHQLRVEHLRVCHLQTPSSEVMGRRLPGIDDGRRQLDLLGPPTSDLDHPTLLVPLELEPAGLAPLRVPELQHLQLRHSLGQLGRQLEDALSLLPVRVAVEEIARHGERLQLVRGLGAEKPVDEMAGVDQERGTQLHQTLAHLDQSACERDRGRSDGV